jgi:hypothetical protein
MRKRLAAAALIVTCLASGARAASLDVPPVPYGVAPAPWAVPQPNIIPLPGMIEPHYELGARYWWSEGKTRFSIDSSKLNSTLGSPTSTLTYDNVQANTGEFTFRARDEGNWFAKGFVGGGLLTGGNLDDRDFEAGQVMFSDTSSNLDGNGFVYGTLDVGKRFTLGGGPTRVSVSPYIGFNLWQEQIEAWGARCKAVDVHLPPPLDCGPAGSIAVPFTTKVINDTESFAGLRIGGELQVKLYDRFTFIGDAAAVPYAHITNEDSHRLRPDLGPGPNIEDSGSGWGYQLEGELRVDLTPCWTVGSGVRYWFAEITDGKSEFTNLHTAVDLPDFTTQRFGVFGDVSYRF